MVILKVEHEGGVQNEFVFTKDNLAFFDIIDIKSQESLKVKYENEINNKKIATQYKNEKAENIVKIGNDPKKETLVVFTDPECPYCRQELSQIDKRLEKFNIEMIFVPVHGISSYQKSALILKHTRKAKTDNDKIAIVKKYYDEKITLTEKVEDKELENIQKIAKKFQNAGVTGVPRIVEKSKIIK